MWERRGGRAEWMGEWDERERRGRVYIDGRVV